MKFGNKKEKKEEKNKEEEIEIVIGDDSELDISTVGDYMNDLRPKIEQHKKVVIPKLKKKDDNNSSKKNKE